MKVIADVDLIPMGTKSFSVSPYIVECIKQLNMKHKNIKYNLHASGTNLEGDLADIMHVLKEWTTTVHEMGAPRVDMSLRIISRANTKDLSIESVMQKVQKEQAGL